MSRQMMGLREYAAHRKALGLVGVTLAAVQKAISSNRITTVTDEKGRTKIDPAVADIQWSRNTDPDQSARTNAAHLAAGSTGNEPPSSRREEDEPSAYWVAKTRREQNAADREALLLDQLRGSLIEKDAARRAAFDAGRLLRDQILSVPSKLAAEFAAMTDPRAIETRMRDELRKPLEQIVQLARAGMDEEEPS